MEFLPPSSPVLGLLLAALAGAALLLWWLSRPRRMPFRRRDSLLTPGERRFYAVLVKAAPADVAILPKVRVLDALEVLPKAWGRYGRPASGLHFDFLLADDALRPLAAVELDDRSHQRPDAQRRDAFKDGACHGAGLPLLRVPVVRHYDVAALRRQLREALAEGES